MNSSAAFDNFLCPYCVSVKRAQADKPLAPSVKYEVEIRRFRSLYGLEIMDSEIILRPSKIPSYGERNKK